MLPVLSAVHSWITDVLLQGTLTTCPCLCWWALERACSDLKRRRETGYSWAVALSLEAHLLKELVLAQPWDPQRCHLWLYTSPLHTLKGLRSGQQGGDVQSPDISDWEDRRGRASTW